MEVTNKIKEFMRAIQVFILMHTRIRYLRDSAGRGNKVKRTQGAKIIAKIMNLPGHKLN